MHVITPNAGLRDPDTLVTGAAIRGVRRRRRAPGQRRLPRGRSSEARARSPRDVGPECDVVLLGSIASPKYVDVLLAIFGERLLFPVDFVGRGDMSRGGLLLRQAAEGTELSYAPVAGAVRHGARPPKLPPLQWRVS